MREGRKEKMRKKRGEAGRKLRKGREDEKINKEAGKKKRREAGERKKTDGKRKRREARRKKRRHVGIEEKN